MKKVFLTLLIFVTVYIAQGQKAFSVSTDLSLMRNFSPDQEFWAVGQTVIANVHFSKKESIYAWITYFSPGRFDNNFTAIARSPFTSPSETRFKVKGSWVNREVSIGWKHYFRGGYDEASRLSIYGRAGFGLMVTDAENIFDPRPVDSLYQLPATPIEGSHKFKRLTLDLAAGAELPLSGGFFIYGEARTWLPSSGFPSPVLHNTKNVPLPVIVGIGLRILFNYY